MGWFSKKKTCDWCGAHFEGKGLESDGFLLCSEGCLHLKDAPPLETNKTPVVDVSPESVFETLKNARRRFEDALLRVELLIKSGGAGLTQTVFEVQKAETEAWSLLQEASTGLRSLGIDTSRFDAVANEPPRSADTTQRDLNSIEFAFHAEFGDLDGRKALFFKGLETLEQLLATQG